MWRAWANKMPTQILKEQGSVSPLDTLTWPLSSTVTGAWGFDLSSNLGLSLGLNCRCWSCKVLSSGPASGNQICRTRALAAGRMYLGSQCRRIPACRGSRMGFILHSLRRNPLQGRFECHHSVCALCPGHSRAESQHPALLSQR